MRFMIVYIYIKLTVVDDTFIIFNLHLVIITMAAFLIYQGTGRCTSGAAYALVPTEVFMWARLK